MRDYTLSPDRYLNKIESLTDEVAALRAERDELRACLTSFAKWHHNQLEPSKLHDPANVDIEECRALSCKAYREVMGRDAPTTLSEFFDANPDLAIEDPSE
jgi:hypothetical protein